MNNCSAEIKTSKDVLDSCVVNKKRKFPGEFENASKKKANVKDIDLELSSMDIIPILANDYTKSVETEKMYVGRITEKKETSRLIKEFSSVWPLEGKSHLKRVRWTAQKGIFEILIRPVLEDDKNSSESYPLKQILGNHPINVLGLEDNVTVTEVAKFAPTTNSQYRDAMQFWPVQFRENKYIEKVLSGKLFDSDDKKRIASFMKICSNAAQHGDEKVGCVIVDPTSSQVVIAHDRRQQHPVQHAVMVATDLVARSQGGGSWDIDSPHVYYQPYSKEEADQKFSELKKCHPDKDVKKLSLPYLCTGYDAYLTREPCIMCAMALVHSRIRRVFYASKVQWGALGSHCKLHLQDGLNHHYEVFQVEMKDAFNETEKDNSKDDPIS